MKKTSMLLFLLLAACATPWVAPSQNYMLDGENLRISGVLNQKRNAGQVMLGGMTNELVVTINGETAVQGILSNGHSGELSGNYKNHTVTALCSSERKTASWVAVTCPILIDEKRTVTLTF